MDFAAALPEVLRRNPHPNSSNVDRPLVPCIRFVTICAALSLAVPRLFAKPNIVLVLADDLGYGDLGCYGQSEIATPQIDRLAAEGMRFTDAYAGSTVCAPSRCALLTGSNTGHGTVRGNRHPGMTSGYYLSTADRTVGNVLRDAGYATAAIGKWSMGELGAEASGMPGPMGFDYFFGYLNQTHAHNSYPSHLWRNDQRVELPNTVPDERPNGAGVSDNKLVYSEDLFIEEVLSYIREHRDRPFFLYFAPTLPHANNQREPMGLETPNLGFYAGRDWPEPKKAWAAMVSRLDFDVGRIMTLLRELGLTDNTLVIFSSDNGPHKEGGADPAFFDSSGPFRGYKRSLHDGGIRIPTIAFWPGHVPAGSTSHAPWYFPDILPTLAAAAGAPIPSGLDGANTLPTLLGKPQPDLSRRLLYWEFHEGGFRCAARRGSWKVVRPGPEADLELYDLESDPGEQHDVAAAHPEVIARFEADLKEARTASPDWPIASGG